MTSRIRFLNMSLTVALLTAAVMQSVPAQGVRKLGTAAAPFLRIPVGARASGMGNAFVSMQGDPASLYWNPAGLALTPSTSIGIEHVSWMPGIDFEFGGLVLPLGSAGTVGISAIVLHTDEIEITTPVDQMGTGDTYTAMSGAFGVSYCRSLTTTFSIGGTFKYIHERIYNTAASGIAFDIGTLFETPFAGIRLGASISNFGTKMRMDGEDLNVRVDIAPDQEGNNQSVVGRLHTDEFDLPLVMRVGVSGEVFDTEDLRVTLAADGVNPNDNMPSVNAGAEVALFGNMLVFRGGYRDLFLEDSEFGMSFGIGVNEVAVAGSLTVTVAYAYQQMVHLGSSDRFSLIVRF